MQKVAIKNLDVSLANAFRVFALRRLCVDLSAVPVYAVKLAVLLLYFPFATLAASDLDNAVVLVLSPYDQSVVIELPDSDMQALSVGQSPEGIDVVLVDVLNDRAVFEEVVLNDSGEKRKETVWIYKAVNGVSRVHRLSRQAPAEPVHEFTRVISSESKADTATTK